MREDETYRQERPVVYLIGIGMGGEDQLTGQAIDRLEGAEAVMGAGRMLGSVEPISPARWFSGLVPFHGRRPLWCFPATRAFTAGQRLLPRPLYGKAGMWNIFREFPVFPISAPESAEAGRMYIR